MLLPMIGDMNKKILESSGRGLALKVKVWGIILIEEFIGHHCEVIENLMQVNPFYQLHNVKQPI